jgi:hypothetical protein
LARQPRGCGGLDARLLHAGARKDFFARYDATKGRFRTFLRTCLDAYVANERRAAGRLKRGGNAPHTGLDFETAEGELRLVPLAAAGDPDTLFHQEWVRSLFGIAVERLRADCTAAGKQLQFALFERYDLDGNEAPVRPTYRDLAGTFGIAETQVTNHLAAMRREFRRHVLAALRELCATDAEFRAEARELWGGEA